jgi:hypothetical protein
MKQFRERVFTLVYSRNLAVPRHVGPLSAENHCTFSAEVAKAAASETGMPENACRDIEDG